MSKIKICCEMMKISLKYKSVRIIDGFAFIFYGEKLITIIFYCPFCGKKIMSVTNDG